MTKPKTYQQQQYAEMRESGYSAKDALHYAKILANFRDREDEDVRIFAEPERENYFDVYGKPEGYTSNQGKRVSAAEEKAKIIDQINLHGLWYVRAEFLNNLGEWEHADSIGMFIGNPTKWQDNPYLFDLMSAALSAADMRFVGV